MPSTKPFPTILHEWTEVIARQNMREFKRFMDEADLSPSQINALFRLHFGGMCGISEIAGHLGVTDPAASQMPGLQIKGLPYTLVIGPDGRVQGSRLGRLDESRLNSILQRLAPR